jgi:predicted O-linked N-acetylglucosamine transferase (SPINDLY family)
VLDQFLARGIEAERVLLEGPAEHYAFLQKYDRIDVALDAFPYNGGTTTMEAIWQGVPVLTFAGDRWASRTSHSLLHGTPLAAFITPDVRSHIERAVALARDSATPPMLTELRRQMRVALQNSPVCHTRAFTRHMERLYQSVG